MTDQYRIRVCSDEEFGHFFDVYSTSEEDLLEAVRYHINEHKLHDAKNGPIMICISTPDLRNG